METAVEWLGFQLNMLFTDITEEQWDKTEKLFQQAKAMEKEQIIEAYCNGDDNISAKQYYNETYKNTEQ